MIVLERIETPAELRYAAELLWGDALTAREREALLDAVRDYQDRRMYRRTTATGRLVAA